MGWIYSVSGGCFLLLAFMLWKESTRENTSRLGWRIIASVWAVTSFACIALPASWKRTATVNADVQAVLLTDGYNSDSVKNFLQKFPKPPVVYSMADEEKLPAFIYPVRVVDQDSLSTIIKKYAAVHVFGYGFGKQAIGSLQEDAFVFHPSRLQTGIHSIHWIRKLRQGENLMVQGTLHNAGSSSVKILFTGLQAHLDSAMIPPASTSGFALSAVPKFAGKALYGITVLSGSDTLEQEPLPVQVDSSSAIKVLVLSSSPDFENKFLKDWLAKHGYEVSIRTVITTNKYNRLSVNAAAKPAGLISQAQLQQVDVLISDPASLTSLSAAELHTVTSQVAVNGMGLIIRADSLLPRSFYAGYFPLTQSTDSVQQQLSLFTNDVVPDTATWLTEQPLYIRALSTTQPLVSGTQANTVVSSALYGTGKIVLSTVNNSYSWLLSGNEKMYGSFWSLLIKKAVRKNAENESWSYSPELPVVNEPVNIKLETDAAGIPQNTFSGAILSYSQNALLPFQWQALYWPAQGWQKASGSPAYSWFVYDKKNWRNLRANRHLMFTRSYLLKHGPGKKRMDKEPESVAVLIPKIYFFIIFIISAAYLWIEKKLM